MTIDDRIAIQLGKLIMQSVMLDMQREEAQKKVDDLTKELEEIKTKNEEHPT